MPRRLLPPAVLLVATSTLSAADWTQFRGPGGQGSSPEKGLPVAWGPNQNLAWKTDLPGPGTSSPVFLGDRLYLTCFTGYNVPGRPPGDQANLNRHVLCLDRKSGRVVWDREYAPKLPEQETIRDGHGYASSTPAVDADGIVVFFGKSGVVGLDHTGKQLWHADVGSNLHGWGSAASPVIHDGLVFVNASVESESLFALDRKTGKEVWRARGIRESWNTPVLVKNKTGGTELVVAILGKVLGFDPATGNQLWSCATDIGWYMVPSVVAHGDVVYCIGGRDGGGSLAVRTGGRGDVTRTHRLWAVKKGANVPSPVFRDGHLFWVNESTGAACCADAATGTVLYEERLPRIGIVYASALLADGNVYYLDRGGRCCVVAAKPAYELLGTNDLRDGSIFNATPVAVDGRLFIRSDKALYCLEKK
jgi:outer membrane protein assembly factor BamB